MDKLKRTRSKGDYGQLDEVTRPAATPAADFLPCRLELVQRCLLHDFTKQHLNLQSVALYQSDEMWNCRRFPQDGEFEGVSLVGGNVQHHHDDDDDNRQSHRPVPGRESAGAL